MYKFEIVANSIEELQDKINEFVGEAKVNTVLTKIAKNSTYGSFGDVEPDLDTEATEVVDSIQHAQTATVPHLVQPPVAPTPELNNKDNLDSRGLPWDSRIHSVGKSKNTDGTWRTRRGVDPTLVTQVEKEISHLSIAPSFSAPIPPVPPSSVPAAMPTFQQPQVDNNGFNIPPQSPLQYQQPGPWMAQPNPMLEPIPYQQPVQPVAPVAALNVPDQTQSASPAADIINNAYNNIAIPTGVKPAHTLASFTNNLTTLLAQLIGEKKIDQNYIQTLCDHFQVKNIWNVTASGVKTRELYESFAKFGFITKLD